MQVRLLGISLGPFTIVLAREAAPVDDATARRRTVDRPDVGSQLLADARYGVD